ncbi:bile acid:sodium symporter family protein [Aliiroseovarius lamellibrachiae]|uniref:bile acid:sodium symporter family protein n=1 Tax=Aliiroseovarius lamellibrachiae TaxID=1924933 RepID=UPI001BDFCDC1|nr:hypothetical protein [Aliiroseovarius lamellibrachiae]MBT2131861.1 hypothetical protein [Aliiroseovarius lamellibrachiae]
MTDLLAKLLPLGLALLMFVVGLRLRPHDVWAVFRTPKALAVGLAVQMLALPILAFVLGRALGLSAVMQAGLVLVAAAPGGVTSNYIAYLVRADLALSTGMTLITTLLASLTIPLILTLCGVEGIGTGAGLVKLSLAMLAVSIVPLLLGMSLVAASKRISARVLKVMEPVARMVFFAMVAATFIQNWGPMQANLADVGISVIALNLGALALGSGAAWMMGLSWEQGRAIMVEASLQNVAVALFVAGSVLAQPALSVPALIYAVVMNISALVQIALRSRGAALTV